MILASSSLAVFFAAVSIVSACALAFLVLTQERKPLSPQGPEAFHLHLNALSSLSRDKVRRQLRDVNERNASENQ
ncbi:MAG: hypothetical protein NT119_05495 [Actinobacteria bacterium]|nr:hypothetical protein [Actinomycetota bacterium]